MITPMGLTKRAYRVVRGTVEVSAEIPFALTHRHWPRVLANSMPKAGTNLLIRLLSLIGFWHKDFLEMGPDEGLVTVTPDHYRCLKAFVMAIRPGFFPSAHLYFYPELGELLKQRGVKTLIIMRHPADVCVSDMFHIRNNRDHRLHSFYLQMRPEDQLMASISGLTSVQLNGGPPSLDIGSHYRRYLGWVTHEPGMVVKFEDLIGHRGIGDDDRQREAVMAVARFLGIGLTDGRLQDICERLFWVKSRTFRKGQIGGWREHFTPQHLDALKRVMGNVLKVFGYE